MEDTAFSAEGAAYSKARGDRRVFCVPACEATRPGSCLIPPQQALCSVKLKAGKVSDFEYEHTYNTIRFKCFQAGASQRKYLLTVNICGLKESSADYGTQFQI